MVIYHISSGADPDPNPDPDPHVFGPLGSGSGSGSTSQRYGSGSGSFYHHVKIVRKTLIPTVLWLFLTLKNDVNVASKVISRKNCVTANTIYCTLRYVRTRQSQTEFNRITINTGLSPFQVMKTHNKTFCEPLDSLKRKNGRCQRLYTRREKVRGATVHKAGGKYQHDWLYLQSINSIKHQ